MAADPGSKPPAPCPEKAVEVALNEFNALRAEIVSRRSTQSAVVGVGLTAIGVVFGLAFNQGGNKDLLLGVPPLALIASLLYLSETYVINGLGRHIRENVWTFLQRQTGYEHSWEIAGDEALTGWKRYAALALFSAPAPFLFTVLAGIALWQAGTKDLWTWLGLGAIAATLAAAVAVIAVRAGRWPTPPLAMGGG